VIEGTVSDEKRKEIGEMEIGKVKNGRKCGIDDGNAVSGGWTGWNEVSDVDGLEFGGSTTINAVGDRSIGKAGVCI
jgi:hypothetical protein